MQHNLLANFLLFHTVLPVEQWLRILSHLSTFPLTKLPAYQFWYSHYRCKNEVKTTFNFKEKVTKQQFDLLFLESKEFAFVSNRQKNGLVGNPNGSFALVQPSFLDMVKNDLLQGEKILIQKKLVVLEGYHWESYLIFHLEISEERVLIFIQEMNALPIFTEETENTENQTMQKQQDVRKTYEELIKRLDVFFEPILYQLLGEREWRDKANKYCRDLITMLENYKELKRVIECRQQYKDKKRTRIEYNFTAVMLFMLSSSLQKAET